MRLIVLGRLEDNDALISLAGLENISSIGGYLFIKANNNSANLSALQNLTSIGGFLCLSHSPLISDLSGLKDLKSIGEKLIISENVKLTSLAGSENLTQSIEELRITNNPLLDNCSIQIICDHLRSNKISKIENNKPNCNDNSEILAECLPVGIQEETLTDLINIYPNPSTGFITIKTEENNMSKAAISLRSVYGEQIIQLHNHQQKSKMVWYFNLPSGFYYLNQHLV